MDWPIYFKDRLIVDNLDSNVGVATLWMPRESVAAVLKKGSFSVCGQLYTKRGINPLLRNILANPKIRYLVVCGVDRQGSGEALIKFFKNGVEPRSDKSGELQGWKIIDEKEALINKEIPVEALELLRSNVRVLDFRAESLESIATKILTLKSLPAFAKPRVFDEPEKLAIKQYPSDVSVFKIRRDYIGNAWLDALKIINRFGIEIPGMYGKVKEVQNLSIIIEKEDPERPKFYDYFKFAQDGLDLYIKGFFEKSKGSSSYTYGERIMDWDGIDQAQIMTDKLKRFPYDRGALAVLWKPHKDNFPPSNEEIKQLGQTKGWQVPCLVIILGQCLGDSFNMTAVFRNNDIFGGWPLNAFALRSFQQKIARDIGKNLGSLTTISHIAEIYEIDWDDSLKIVAENNNLGRTCIYDPRSYYIVAVEKNEIVLTFMSPDGLTQLAQFREDGKKPKVARDLCAIALRDMLISELGAAADLGRQLAKAETAVKLGLKFEQDQPLKPL